MATALWVKTIRHNRTDRQTTVPCNRADAHRALLEACHELDLPEPIWLDKNEREWDEFGMTRFLPDAFFESVPFEKLEIAVFSVEMDRREIADDQERNDGSGGEHFMAAKREEH